MKIYYLLISGIIVLLATSIIGIYQANTAPLPKGFPEITAPNQSDLLVWVRVISLSISLVVLVWWC